MEKRNNDFRSGNWAASLALAAFCICAAEFLFFLRDGSPGDLWNAPGLLFAAVFACTSCLILISNKAAKLLAPGERDTGAEKESR